MDLEMKNKISDLPLLPGVYLFYDREGVILYVGKAKKLKKRVASYFNRTHDGKRLRLLVEKISRFEVVVVDSETDALLLENTLIKRHQPFYNILLKDSKTYPWICVKNEPFPRVFITRTRLKDKSTYFGPYTAVRKMKLMVDLLHRIYKLRTCPHSLSQSNIENGKIKVCLEYHIGNCLAPCIAKQTKSEYDLAIEQLVNILNGNVKKAANFFKLRMEHFSADFRFEEAQLAKENYNLLANFYEKSIVVSDSTSNFELLSMLDKENYAYFNYMQLVNGMIIRSQNFRIQKRLDENSDSLLLAATLEMRQKYNSKMAEIVLPQKLSYTIQGLAYTVPVRGVKRKLLALSHKNAFELYSEHVKQMERVNPELYVEQFLATVKADLRMPEIPTHIECFDNSHFQGTNYVAACVVFENAKPKKAAYRHYHIKTVSGSDDYAAMEEVVYRRYKRLLDENSPLPQLIVIDGGKGQLSSALNSLKKLALDTKITVIGIAKRLEEIYFPNDPVPIYLDKRSQSLKLIQQLRNEAHRFGITFHRKTRMKKMATTELSAIAGIGNKTADKLLQKFKSVAAIKKMSLSELEAVLGAARAKLVHNHYHQ